MYSAGFPAIPARAMARAPDKQEVKNILKTETLCRPDGAPIKV